MTTTRPRRGLRPGGARARTIDRIRADLGSWDAIAAFAGAKVGAVVETSLVLEPFGLAEAGRRPDEGDLLEAQTHGVDARGVLERHPTPAGTGLVPVLRTGDLALLLPSSESFPTGARLEVEGFLYAFPIAWDEVHGLRVRGARRRWRIAGIQRRDVDETAEPGCAIRRTTVDRVPDQEELDDSSLVELDLRRP